MSKFRVTFIAALLFIPVISDKVEWTQHSITVASGMGIYNATNQLSCPVGMYVDDDKTVYVADYDNHRIMQRTVNCSMKSKGSVEYFTRCDHGRQRISIHF